MPIGIMMKHIQNICSHRAIHINRNIWNLILFVLEVDDIAAMYKSVLAQNWPLSGALQTQPWGLTDFRLLDPDGYYLRITSRG